MQEDREKKNDFNKNGIVSTKESPPAADKEDFPLKSKSKELIQELFLQYPHLRGQLREIYQVTLQEAWIEDQDQPEDRYGTGGGYSRGRRRVMKKNRGPWTEEKGFRRGLGRVRKFREQVAAGYGLQYEAEKKKDLQGLVRFMDLVINQRDTT